VDLTGITTTVSGPFQLSGTCSSQLLAAGASCSMVVVYAPTAVGAQTGTLTVVDALTTQTISLSGTGVSPPVMTVSPSALNFGQQTAGTTSAAKLLTVTNSGGSSMAGVSFAISGTAASSFVLGATTCGTSLSSGASCTTEVSFAPASNGSATALLAVSTSTASVSAVSVQLTGNGGVYAAQIQATPSVLSFGTVGLGLTSSSQTVRVYNPGTSDSLQSLTLTPSAGFTLTNNTCTSTLAAQSVCTVGVVFAPTQAAAYSGTLTISATGVTSVAVGLVGTGFSFTVAISGSSSQIVANGQTADFTLTITPLGGGTGDFSFSCSSLPKHAACVFNPTSLSSSSVGTVSLAIETGLTTAYSLPPPRRSQLPYPVFVAIAPLLLAGRLRRRSSLLRRVMLALLMVAFVAGSGCTGSGGGNKNQSSQIGTPTGTYVIPVVVNGNGLLKSASVTLVVD